MAQKLMNIVEPTGNNSYPEETEIVIDEELDL